MEVLTALISQAIQHQILNPIRGISVLQRLSIYADDVVLFVQPLPSDLLAVKEVLNMFGEASGLHINYNKSTATLIRGTEAEAQRIRDVLQCRMEDFPIKYLGL
jgi:hypothetical protein